MDVSISAVCHKLEKRGLLRRSRKDHSEGIVKQVRDLLGGRMPPNLEALYRERVDSIGDFDAVLPTWNPRPEWRREREIRKLLPVEAVPIFFDGCGNLYGLDLSSENRQPAVYFFDREYFFERPHWAAGSSLARFLVLLSQRDEAFREGRPTGWELSLDPDLDKCPRAPPIWLAG